MPKKSPEWTAIRREWDAGQLTVVTIARLHGDGITPQAINNRAKREGWTFPRPVTNGRVPGLVSPPHAVTETVTDRNETSKQTSASDPSVALALFGRVMGVLMTERRDLREIDDHYSWLMGRIRAKREAIDAGGAGRAKGSMSLKEMQMFGALLKDLAITKKTVIPLIRRAYGLTDEDGPSELDKLSDETLSAAEAKLREVLAELGVQI